MDMSTPKDASVLVAIGTRKGLWLARSDDRQHGGKPPRPRDAAHDREHQPGGRRRKREAERRSLQRKGDPAAPR